MGERKQRAIDDGDNEVGKIRQSLYRNVIEKSKKAEESGYYLEAITLYESMITDRLESALTKVTGENYGFMTLGQLIPLVKKHMPGSVLEKLMTDELDPWRVKRNNSLHGMAKLPEGETKRFEDEYSKCKDHCAEGKAIFRAIDREVSKIKAK